MTIAKATARVNSARNHFFSIRDYPTTPPEMLAEAEAQVAAAEKALEEAIEAAIASR